MYSHLGAARGSDPPHLRRETKKLSTRIYPESRGHWFIYKYRLVCTVSVTGLCVPVSARRRTRMRGGGRGCEAADVDARRRTRMRGGGRGCEAAV